MNKALILWAALACAPAAWAGGEEGAAAPAPLYDYRAPSPIRFASLPPVPEGWNVSIEGKTVLYSSPGISSRDPTPAATVRFGYSASTRGLTAKALVEQYSERYKCRKSQRLGFCFYSTSCPSLGIDFIAVGEVDNLYTIEINGRYTRESVGLVNTYLTEVVSGKYTFLDRNIGENVPDPVTYNEKGEAVSAD